MSDFSDQRAELANRIGTLAELVSPDILQPADLFFDLAGEDIGRRLMLTNGPDGTTYCLRPDFTLPIAAQYLAGDAVGLSKNYGYLGPVFRQRDYGPFEFDQAGLEFLAPKDSDKTFSEVMHFAIEASALYGETAPRLHLGAVDLFETLLAKIDLPDVWRPRVRDRFGHDAAMGRLLDRLAVPEQFDGANDLPSDDAELTKKVAAEMDAAGLSPYSGRQAEEIVARYREKQMLAQAAVSPKTVRILREFLSIAGPASEQAFRVAGLAKKVGIDLDEPLEKLMTRLTELKATAPAQAQSMLHVGQQVVFSVQGLADQTFNGQINRVNPVADMMSRTLTFYARVDNPNNVLRAGLFAEGVYNNQSFFHNYTATVLTAPAFEPLSESKTLFQENFRAHNYLAVGLKNIFQITKNMQFRVEGYLFQPHQNILQNANKEAYYGKVWDEGHIIYSSSLVYKTPLGPIALNANYYEQFEDHWSFMFHFGYILFKKKSLE
nr:ATP phosphoribosyltransferase regulatory subunit [uncultured Maritalea sp.]